MDKKSNNKLKFLKNIIVLIFLPAFLFSCNAFTGKEVGRLKIDQISTDQNQNIAETTIELKKDDKIRIWTDMDIEYDGNIELRFFIEVYLDNEKTDEIEIDPFNKHVTVKESKISINGNTKWKFSGKSKELSFDKDGKYTFKAKLMSGLNDDILIKQADLVFKK